MENTFECFTTQKCARKNARKETIHKLKFTEPSNFLSKKIEQINIKLKFTDKTNFEKQHESFRFKISSQNFTSFLLHIQRSLENKLKTKL